jgi:hypothetical protein
MESQYIYWIVALVILAIVALAVILRYGKAKISVRAPGVGFDAEGETGPEQPQSAPQAKPPSATTTIGGSVRKSTVMTDAGGGGQAATDVGRDVEESDILTEA